MKQERTSDQRESNERSGPERVHGQEAHELKAFEDLISSEENVEYEEDHLLEAMNDPAGLSGPSSVSMPSLAVDPVSTNGGKISIPLRIRQEGGHDDEYCLELSVALHKAEKGVSSVKEMESPQVPYDDEEEMEIDILDGRTTLIFQEEDESEEEIDSLEDEPERGWWERLFFFWRDK
jgi:hypothetical protein